MRFSVGQLSNRRWGIYSDSKLLATYDCRDTCLKVLELLQTKQILSNNSYKQSTQIAEKAA
jgi:hypothetical protein